MEEPIRYRPREPLLIIVGNFGSGKTEVSVNLAIHLSETHPVRIVDLDIVNPYFRCREAREEMEAHGVEVIYPKGEFHSADLPIILPEVKGAIAAEEGYTILDVGGDDLGARVLSSFVDLLRVRPHEVLQVVNAHRPFTEDVAGCVRIKREIEEASRLSVTGLISNTHLMEETDLRTVRDGLRLAREVAEAEGLTLAFATAEPALLPDLADEGLPFLAIERRMLPPWKLRRKTDRAGWLLDHS